MHVCILRRLSDVLKRKRPAKQGPARKGKTDEAGPETGKNSGSGRPSSGRGKSASGRFFSTACLIARWTR